MVTGVQKVIFPILIVTLALAGLFLLSFGWWLPEVSIPVRLLGVGWLLVCITTGFIKQRPYLQLASSWLWALVSVWWWWTTTREKSAEWFLYQDMFPLIVLACSNLLPLASGSRVRR
jgi:hypothetical protein